MAQSLTTLQSTALGPVLTVSGVSPTVAVTTTAYPGSATAADPAGGETLTITGTGFNAGVKVYVGSTICTTTYVSATSLTFVSPANSVGSYVLYVYNTDGTNGASPAGITYSAIPVWITASGALTGGFTNLSYSTSVSATGDSIVYSVTSGSLPTGLSLNASTGAITGTPTVVATSNFTITATDAQNQGVARSFSIAVIDAISVDYLVVAGGGGGSDYGAGGAGGYLTASGSAAIPGTTYTVTVGAGGTGAATGTAGDNSVFGAITATGGGRGGKANAGAGTNGGSGGGGGYNSGAGGKGIYPGSTYIDGPRQGYDGGVGAAGVGPFMAGGGGGAGAVGGNGISTKGGDGGVGLASSITGTSTFYAGGGGGGGFQGSPAASGGNGGGGAGGIGSGGDLSGTVNTGGGGGGRGTTDGAGGTGGSGVVILRFLSTVTVVGTTGSPTITTDGSYKVYKFTGSGSITF